MSVVNGGSAWLSPAAILKKFGAKKRRVKVQNDEYRVTILILLERLFLSLFKFVDHTRVLLADDYVFFFHSVLCSCL